MLCSKDTANKGPNIYTLESPILMNLAVEQKGWAPLDKKLLHCPHKDSSLKHSGILQKIKQLSMAK